MTKIDPADIVGPGEVAEMFGVETNVVSNWRKRGKLPAPVAVLKMGPIWTRDQFAAEVEERIAELRAQLDKINA